MWQHLTGNGHTHITAHAERPTHALTISTVGLSRGVGIACKGLPVSGRERSRERDALDRHAAQFFKDFDLSER